MTVTIETAPRDDAEFAAMRDQRATTPEGGAAMFALALNLFSDGHAEGPSFLGRVIDQKYVSGREPSDMKGFRYFNGAKPYLAHSMIQGTSPASAYARPPLPWTIAITRVVPNGETEAKVFIQTTGADSPKPLTLKRNDKGIWKASEWSSFQGNCRPPQERKPDER